MAVCAMTSSRVLTELTSMATLGVICAVTKYSSMQVRVMKSAVNSANSSCATACALNAARLSYSG
ncbi:hypothetical protein D3C84_1010080 [compost metagenome]